MDESGEAKATDPGVTRRYERLGFGAQCETSGVRFRLWAPAARTVDLVLEEPTAPPIAMKPADEGWFEVMTDAASAGSLYRYRIDGGLAIPDPASRFQPRDAHGPSEVVNGGAFAWTDTAWRGRPWTDAVLYELHVGAFSPEGTYAGAAALLPRLAALGVTAIELMPLADFPGRANWGYDGVLPFAPDSRYGRPEDLKALIMTAHGLGLMVFLDVVYNHFGPDGNYLGCYAPPFFTSRHHTPWGDAINFDGPGSAPVRAYFEANVHYWLNEYHIDGLRFDAVHAIVDDSPQSILTSIARTVEPLRSAGRHIHLILENENNEVHYLERGGFTAQWNDDIHHVLHVLLTGETEGYYADYAQDTMRLLGRCLTEGFAYQGEFSPYRQGPRGEPSAALGAGAFVSFLQNHDQVGNRAFGDRITALACPEAVRAATAVLLLAPSPPMLFMGQEFGCSRPFLFFCDFEADLGRAVTEGRRREFARFGQFADATQRARIPDPNSEETFLASRLDWRETEGKAGAAWLAFHQDLLQARARHLAGRLAQGPVHSLGFELFGERGIAVAWRFADGSFLHLRANLGPTPVTAGYRVAKAAGSSATLLQATKPAPTAEDGALGPWEAYWELWSAARGPAYGA